MTLPKQARIVVIGGGIVGCSTAYHLAKMGCTDVLLLEQGQLTSGTTWHAAGLVGQMRPNRNMTRMSRYGIELYASLEAETGLATGWKQCGSVNVARTPERMQVLRRQIALAKSFGIECEEITPAEAGRLVPVMRTDDLQGAIWLPGDGKANPTDLTHVARQRGAAAWRDDRRRRGGGVDRHAWRRCAAARRRRRRAAEWRAHRHRLRDCRQLCRPMGPPARRPLRGERAAVAGRALLHRHRAHRKAYGPTCR